MFYIYIYIIIYYYSYAQHISLTRNHLKGHIDVKKNIEIEGKVIFQSWFQCILLFV